jgi:hypothetical protein
MNSGRHECFTPIGPRSRTFAPCGVLLPRLGKYATVASHPTRANVACRPASPPVMVPSGRFGQRDVCGNRPPVRHSLFALSGFP